MAAFEIQTYNLLNKQSLSALPTDLQGMSAFTVGLCSSIYTINTPTRSVIAEGGEVPVASVGTWLGHLQLGCANAEEGSAECAAV